MYYIIYKTTNLINGRFYLGMHQTDNLDDGYLGSGKLLKQAISKYGKENFSREILVMCFSYEDMCEVERYLVTQDLVESEDCYNLCLGGLGGPLQTDLIKKARIETCYEKYGVSHVTKSKEFKDKRSKTIHERYGVLDINLAEGVSFKKIQAYIDRYGVDHPSKSQEVKDKWRQSHLDKYGVDCYFKTKESRENTSKRTKRRRHIHKDGVNRYIDIDELEYYIEHRWELGRGPLSEEWKNKMRGPRGPMKRVRCEVCNELISINYVKRHQIKCREGRESLL